MRVVALFLPALLLGAAVLSAADKKPASGSAELVANTNIPLWDEGKVPLAAGNGPLDKPFLTVFLPPPEKRNGTAVVVAPGGSNIMLMYGGEGMNIAERFNDWGAAAFVLTYRLSPKYNDAARLLDGKRAIQLVRAHAAAWKIDASKIGYIGFSAGSNMGRSVVAQSTAGDANAADPLDRVSSRPDFLALIYGAGRATQGEQLKNFPPTFLLAAAADAGNANGSAQLFIDLNKAGATAEVHLYQKGRHGFGDGYGDPNFSDWMGRLEHFLKFDGFLPGGEK